MALRHARPWLVTPGRARDFGKGALRGRRAHPLRVFTGIVQGQCAVSSAAKAESGESMALTMQFPEGALEGLETGASVAINGACLTAVDIDAEAATCRFDVIVETLRATNLGDLAEGSNANFERAAKIGDEIGGHNVSGHVNCVAEVVDVQTTEDNRRIEFALPSSLGKYVFPKGYVAVDGTSLTVGEVTRGGEGGSDTFSVYLIPETLRVTTLGERGEGGRVNIELDSATVAIVDTVERVLAERETVA